MSEEQPAAAASQGEGNNPIESEEIQPEVAEETKPAEPVAAEEQETPSPVSAGEQTSSAEADAVEQSEPVEDIAAPTEKPAQTIIAPAEINESVPFMIKFLEHLGVLRKEANSKRREEMEKRLIAILEYAREHGQVTNDEVEKITGIGDRQALNYLKILVKQGKLTRFGLGLGSIYKPKG